MTNAHARRAISSQISRSLAAVAACLACAGGRPPAAVAQTTVPARPQDVLPATAPAPAPEFAGTWFRGRGDPEFLYLLDIGRRMFAPDPEFQNVPMLYAPEWNGFTEGPTWTGWWIQNSYGTTYAAIPFLPEPLLTFLQNSHDLWFDQMGDGRTPRPYQHYDGRRFDWVPPDGCLCDCARPGWFVAKQGDGRVALHDWALEFTAAGIVMQADLLLATRSPAAIARYLPLLERCADFVEKRRDPAKNLFWAGPAANLLAPSYAGYLDLVTRRYEWAYLAGLSITYIAALDRLIEVEKLAERPERAREFQSRRDRAVSGLALLKAPGGYFVKSLDPEGTLHGVYGAAQYGYFEASPNHDAIAFRIVDDATAGIIYDKIASLRGLRPYDFILANYPSLDDMYEPPTGLWSFGTWVNGGHWSTCEGRMILGYMRLGKFEDARRSLRRLLTFARRFRMDNPLTKFGSEVYQPKQPVNLTYDAFAPPAALVRGLFEYLYTAEGVRLVPHIPPQIQELEQRFPVRLGTRRLYLATRGNGPVTSVTINGNAWRGFDRTSVFLPYADVPDHADVAIYLGAAAPERTASGTAAQRPATRAAPPFVSAPVTQPEDARLRRLRAFRAALGANGFADSYEAAHIELILDAFAVIAERARLLRELRVPQLPEESRAAAEQLYTDTAERLYSGWLRVVEGYAASAGDRPASIARLWDASASVSPPAP